MRRGRPEWLVLPLFLLPVGVAAVLCLEARGRYEAEMARARRDGHAIAEQWLKGSPGGGEGWVRRFAADVATPSPAATLRFDDTLAVCAGEGEWIFSSRYPGSL